MRLSDQLKAISAASIGGGLEMYDFVIYIFFAPILAKLFFPPTDHFISIVYIYGVFAIGYLSRPIGAVLFGHYGDRLGRKKGLLMTILLMAAATTLMGLMPTYAMVGRLAPVLLLVFRIMQGVAVGGDLPGGITLIAEGSNPKTRGFHCSIIFFGVNAGILLASGVGVLLTNLLTHQQLVSYGWRIAFFLGLVIAYIGYFIRHRLLETPFFTRLMTLKQRSRQPLLQVFKTHKKSFIKGVGLVSLFSVVIVQLFLYMPSFLHDAHLSLKTAMILNTVSLAVFTMLIPLMGYLSDKLNRKPMLAIASMFFMTCSYFCYELVISRHLSDAIFGLLLFDVFAAAMPAIVPVVLSELFETKIRYTGVAITYNIGFAFFAGLTPITLTFLRAHIVPETLGMSVTLMVAGAFCLIATLTLKEQSQKKLPDRKGAFKHYRMDPAVKPQDDRVD